MGQGGAQTHKHTIRHPNGLSVHQKPMVDISFILNHCHLIPAAASGTQGTNYGMNR